MSSIRLDPKHAVNPSVETCFLCGKDMGVILFGKLTAQQKRMFEEAELSGTDPDKAPRSVSLGNICDECQDHMKVGIILISVDEDRTTDPQNPYRTGGFCVVREEALERMINDAQVREHIRKKRVAFVPDDAWAAIGLPR